MRHAGSTLLLVLMVVSGAVGAPAAHAIPRSLQLVPSRASGVARAGIVVGPFAIKNFTATPYMVRVLPTFLTQAPTGAISVATDPDSLRRARLLMTGRARARLMRPGDRITARTRVRRVTRDDNLYAGLVFEAVPTRSAAGIRQVIQLGASIYLHPPPPLRRIALRGQAPRGEVRRRRLVLLAPFENVGNMFVTARGKVTVRDGRGKVVFTRFAKPMPYLPRATVEIPVEVDKVLPKGRYALTSTALVGRRAFRARGELVLLGPNQVATRTARLTGPPQASGYLGQAESVQARYENTGNVPFAPVARLEVFRGQTSEGRPEKVVPLAVDRADPGREAALQGSVPLDGAGPYTLRLRLFDARRELDRAEITVLRERRAGLWDRFANWITEHAITVVLGLATLLILALLAGLLAVLRVRRSSGRR